MEAGLLTAAEAEMLSGTRDYSEYELAEIAKLATDQMVLTNFQVARLIAGHGDDFFYGRHKIKYLQGAQTHARNYVAENIDTQHRVNIKVLRKIYHDDPNVRLQFAEEALRFGSKVTTTEDRVYFVIDPSRGPIE